MTNQGKVAHKPGKGAHDDGARKNGAETDCAETYDAEMDEAQMDDAQQSDAQKRIDHSLKTIYDETLNEELPDRFRELIAELRKQDSQK